MSSEKQELILVRHGETTWTLSGQHTSTTDLPLTVQGKEQARQLHDRLARLQFEHVFTSPLQRAKTTCEISGYAQNAIVDPDLVEWDYGLYEGLTTAQIQEKEPGWNIFTHGAPKGESPTDVSARADRVLARVRALEGNVLLYSSGHFLRALAARYLDLPVASGKLFLLKPATLSILGYEHDCPVLVAWDMFF